jgi:hypothetical protein
MLVAVQLRDLLETGDVVENEDVLIDRRRI